MNITLISDTHNQHSMVRMGSGDVLIHAGDATGMGRKNELKAFIEWYSEQDFTHKIYVPGNHDIGLEQNYEERSKWFTDAGIVLLNDESIIIDDVKIHGSPITPNFGRWAFMKARGEQIQQHWHKIPSDTDILITHGPPHKILDEVQDTWRGGSINTGCEMLWDRVRQVEPKIHVFGHIHEGAGSAKMGKTEFINASVLDERYTMTNNPIVRKL